VIDFGTSITVYCDFLIENSHLVKFKITRNNNFGIKTSFSKLFWIRKTVGISKILKLQNITRPFMPPGQTYQSMYLHMYLPDTFLPMYLLTYLHTYLPTFLDFSYGIEVENMNFTEFM